MSQLCCAKISARYLKPFGLERDELVNQSVSQLGQRVLYEYIDR